MQGKKVRHIVNRTIRRANKQPGHGTYDNDRPPIFSVIERDTQTARYFVGTNAGADDCLQVLESTVPAGAAILYTDEWSGYRRVGPALQLKHARSVTGVPGRVRANGRAMTTVTASAKSIATVAKAMAQRYAPTYAVFVVSTSVSSKTTWRPMKPCITPNASTPC